jgi:hypothetical protein
MTPVLTPAVPIKPALPLVFALAICYRADDASLTGRLAEVKWHEPYGFGDQHHLTPRTVPKYFSPALRAQGTSGLRPASGRTNQGPGLRS